ncbi:hypothetical protein ACIRYZ_37150 [Kitasatospora sp. NPDC101155]|uniref:hypothetical protein n=1 Tax=Kitasatospora sp. NPDC101155 TaxID=3364097 RepID=UPI0037F40CB3
MNLTALPDPAGTGQFTTWRAQRRDAAPAGPWVSGPDAHARLMTVPGIGIWTAAETLQRANGDPDAVSVRDFHLANSLSGQCVHLDDLPGASGR